MMIKLSEDLLAVINTNDGLARYLESLLTGRDFTPRSWLYESIDNPDDILNLWLKQLKRLSDGDEFEQNIFTFDTSQIEKWGPQGGVKPISELMDLVLAGFGDVTTPKAFTTTEWQMAKDVVVQKLHKAGVRKLRPSSYSKVLNDMQQRDTLESNSGWPLFSRRSKPEVKQQSIQAAENGLWKTYPAIALFRNYNGKTRLVWIFPMSANLVEGSFFQPLQKAIIQSGLGTQFFAPWVGFEQVRVLISDAYSRDEYIAASDFSSTDAHFHLATSMQVCDVIEQCFQVQYRNDLRESIEHMHFIPLVIGPDEMVSGYHGVSSGSNWTNFIETIFDWILAEYVAILTQNQHRGLYAIGDDMSWVSDEHDDGFEHFLEQVGESVGQEIKSEKTTNDPDKVKTLQRLFQRGYKRSSDDLLRGVYSTVRALKSSVYPERFHRPKDWSEDMFCARQYMILENCVDHPLFEEFVRFVLRGNRHLVPFAKKTRPELDRILRKTKLLPGFNPTYNQEKRETSLADFESIRIAREL